jgi:membrane-bound lytic murein transglycosylase D
MDSIFPKKIEIECFDETPLSVISEAANTSLKVIKDMNPQLRGHYLSAGQHLIHVPKGSGKGFYARFKSLIKNWDENQKDRVYVVKQGDNLSSIAQRFDIPLPALIIWNDLDYTENIHPGDRLIVRSHGLGLKHDIE